jgi:hypothetical protein
VAWRLSDPGATIPVTDEVKKIIADEVARVERAEGIHYPQWLGAPDELFVGIDYSRFKLNPKESRSRRSAGRARALRWLRTIPLRMDRDESFGAAVLIADAMRESGLGYASRELFIGGPAILQPTATTRDSRFDADALEAARKLRMREPTEFVPGANDLVHQSLTGAAPPQVRLVASGVTPEDVVFRPHIPNKALPLLVGAALGSTSANELLPAELRELAGTKSVELTHVLGREPLLAYLSEMASDVPEVFRTPKWRAKQLNTVMAGWAQSRRAILPQTRLVESWSGGGPNFPGCVEPPVEFWDEMAKELANLRIEWEHDGLFEEDFSDAAIWLRKFVEVSKLGPEAFREGLPDLPETAYYTFAASKYGGGNDGTPDGESLLRLADEIELSEGKVLPEEFAGLRDYRSGRVLGDGFTALERIVAYSRSILRKQLNGIEPSEDERRFCDLFPQYLGNALMYNSNAYLNPLDDAAKVAPIWVHSDDVARLYFHVGVGRPRRIYVLYPWKGEKHVCVGGIMPYLEHESDTALNDEEWRGVLDSAKPPTTPAWLDWPAPVPMRREAKSE